MKIVYIAGPYRAPSEWAILQNIRRAEEMALEVWRSGAACICPHKNTAFFGGAADDRLWLEGDLEMLRRSDAVLCVGTWQLSDGARGEVELARRVGIPVFESLEELRAWLDQDRQRGASHDTETAKLGRHGGRRAKTTA